MRRWVDISSIRSDREGRYFHAVISQVSGIGEDVFYFPIFKILVAGGEFHVEASVSMECKAVCASAGTRAVQR